MNIIITCLLRRMRHDFIIQIMEYYITLRDLNTGRKACASALIDNVVVSFFTFRSLMHPYVLN